MTFDCRHHGPVAGKLTWQPVGAGHRIRVSCDRCGAYIKWAPITAENGGRMLEELNEVVRGVPKARPAVVANLVNGTK